MKIRDFIPPAKNLDVEQSLLRRIGGELAESPEIVELGDDVKNRLDPTYSRVVTPYTNQKIEGTRIVGSNKRQITSETSGNKESLHVHLVGSNASLIVNGYVSADITDVKITNPMSVEIGSGTHMYGNDLGWFIYCNNFSSAQSQTTMIDTSIIAGFVIYGITLSSSAANSIYFDDENGIIRYGTIYLAANTTHTQNTTTPIITIDNNAATALRLTSSAGGLSVHLIGRLI